MPVAFSSGFNQRIRLSFASALGVGVTAEAEPAVLELLDDIHPEEVQSRLNDHLPPCLLITSVETIPDNGSRDLLNQFRLAKYQVWCKYEGEKDDQAIREALHSLLLQEHLSLIRIKEKRTIKKDARPFIQNVTMEQRNQALLELHMSLFLRQDGGVKPSEIVEFLQELLPGITYLKAHRISLTAQYELSIA
jgi:radical SAM-linked protein